MTDSRDKPASAEAIGACRFKLEFSKNNKENKFLFPIAQSRADIASRKWVPTQHSLKRSSGITYFRLEKGSRESQRGTDRTEWNSLYVNCVWNRCSRSLVVGKILQVCSLNFR